MTKGFESQENVECYNKPAGYGDDDDVLMIEKSCFMVLPDGQCGRYRGQMPVFHSVGNQQQRRDEIKRVVGAGHKSGHGESELWTQIETQRAWNQSSKLNQDTRRGYL